MIRARIATVLTLAALAVTSAVLTADVRTEQKTHVQFAGTLGRMVNFFGGKAAKEGVTSTVALKGDRLSTTTGEKGQIIDLGEQKVYDLDLKHRTYTVTTFAELRQKMEEERRKAEEDAKKAEEENKGGKAQEEEPAQQEKEPQAEVDFDVKNTGQTKTINGYDTHEVVMTITVREKGRTLEESGGMVLTSDMWMAPRIPAMQEIAQFYQRYAQELSGPMVVGASEQQMAAAMAMYPMMKDALGRMRTEDTRLDGTPIMTTVTMDAVKSAEQLEAEKKSSEEESKESASGGIGGMLGGFAKRMAKKKAEGGSEPKARATFMTTTSEVLKVTPEVGAADVAVPAGFKQK